MDTPIRKSERKTKGLPPQRLGWEDQAVGIAGRGETTLVSSGDAHAGNEMEMSHSRDDMHHGQEIRGSLRSRSSRMSAVSARRRKIQADLDASLALAKIEEQQQDLERRRLEREQDLEQKRLERQRDIIEKERSLQQAIIDEQLENNASSQGSVRIDLSDSGNYPTERNQAAKDRTEEWIDNQVRSDFSLEQLTQAFAQAIQAGTEIVSQRKSSTENDDMKKFLTRQSTAKDLPYFSGDPEEWTNFISQYRRSTEVCGFSQEENMYRLQKCLRGRARDAVQAMMMIPSNTDEVISVLETSFGRPQFVIKVLIEKVQKISPIKEDRFELLIELSNEVRNLVLTMESLNCIGHMNNPLLIDGIVSKLPPSLKFRWGERVIMMENNNSGSLKDLSGWMSQIARAASVVSTPLKVEEKSKDDRKDKKKGFSTVLATTDDKKKSEERCLFCEENKRDRINHSITSCAVFEKLDVDQRWNWVKGNKICFSCLKTGHRTFRCFKKQICGKDGCTSKHHALLHSPQRPDNHKPEVVINTFQQNKVQKSVLLRIAPVQLKGPLGVVSTFALFDEASTVTLLDQAIADQIGATGPQDNLHLRWTNSEMKQDCISNRVTIQIRGQDHDNAFEVISNVRTIRDLDLPLQSVNVRKLTEKWKYLNQVNLESIQKAKATILIGQDNIDLIIAREIIEGPKNGPVASRTKLGWIIHGNVAPFTNRVDEEFTFFHRCEDREYDALYQLVKDSFKTEDFGVKVVQERLKSKDDERAQRLSDESARRIGNRWEVGLLWKEDNIDLPYSKPNAMTRLRTMERKMDRDALFSKQYCDKITDYLNKGYARKVLPDEEVITAGKIWYLPHFAVTNPNKPGKFRLVFDAAPKTKGVSLNDMLLQGPDLLKSLLGVLFKFRQREVGFTADIREMFHQVAIRREDSCAQRFLWRGVDRHREPDIMEMSVMIFGAVSSPFQAQEIKNKNARELSEEFPNAVDAIVNRHYMDDYLDSSHTTEDAIKLIREVIDVYRRGGFEICSWISSSREVIQAIPKHLRSDKQDVDMNTELSVERVLGLHWNPNTDKFNFICKFTKVEKEIVNNLRKPTKREVLKTVISIFDPLGFLAHFTIKAKILLQDIWRSGIDWDDIVTDSCIEKWGKWITEMKIVTKIEVPRCYSLKMIKARTIQLHMFCDASEKAFAAVAYLRVDLGDEVHVSFVTAKTRVAPLRPITIPRLELQAAVMASRLARTIRNEHELKIDRIFYWSDSQTVLCWLQSDARNYKPFVAHRIGEITELTDAQDWRWISTSENVADEATRDSHNCEHKDDCRWLNGPDFLKCAEADWTTEMPRRSDRHGMEGQEMELKREFVMLTTASLLYTLPDVGRFSSYLRLIRATAWMLRFISRSRKKSDRDKIVSELVKSEYTDAELLWWKKSQLESFPQEIANLTSKKMLIPSSKLISLSPFIDEKGIMRCKGRINEATDLARSMREPVILDPKHQFTKLLLFHHHEQAGHHGQERMVNELRQRYCILKVRAAVRSTWNHCQKCKNDRATPQIPVMAPLPEVRLAAYVRPFHSTGMDYFGPMDVVVGRRREKRYGVLFTCLSIRAVHLELTSSLTTDAAIMAIRRMIGRRGCPQHIYSDNGTNLRGSNNEMLKALSEFEQDRLLSELAQRGIEWHFIPPSAPHMGGSWERLVRSVKVALKATLKERSPRDEVLQTLLVEAEHIVNSRPLTHVSTDPDDPESLTPNHFLIGSSSASVAPGVFSDGDFSHRKQWRIAQRLTDLFWKRWIREYLPTLTRRTKWYQSQRPTKVGDVVVVADGDLLRNCWPRGIVTAVYPGKDGNVRVVDVKTNKGTFRRPVVKICPLDVQE